MFAMNRTNSIGLRFELMELGPEMTRIRYNKKEMTFNHPIQTLNQAWYDWLMGGKLIQEAFSFLSNGEREFILTGTTPAEWDELFNKEEE